MSEQTAWIDVDNEGAFFEVTEHLIIWAID